MSRYIRLSLSLLVLVAACARPTRVVMQPDQYEPLEISILPPSSGFGFWVNQPAYVAMFDIEPGEGVQLLYPVANNQLTRMVQAGSAYARSSFSFGHGAYFAGRSLNQAHFIVAVASRKPLTFNRVVGFSHWMTYKLGVASFSGTSLEMMNGLFEQVVPVQPDDDWATAVYVVYPGVPWRQNMYQLIRCSNGQTYVVNVETRVFYCPAPAAPDQGTAPENPDRSRRPDRPETARTGSAIARAMLGNDLPVLRPMGDVVYRPPDPASYRQQSSSGSGSTSYSRSSSESEYARQPNTARDPGYNQPNTTPQPAAAAPAQPQAEGGAKPEKRGGSDPKDP